MIFLKERILVDMEKHMEDKEMDNLLTTKKPKKKNLLNYFSNQAVKLFGEIE